MSASEVRAGAAYVEATVKDKTAAGLAAIERRLTQVGERITSIGKKMVAGGIAIGAAFTPAILKAGDFVEVMSKFDQVFGENADASRKWADQFAKDVGRSRLQVAQFMADSQALFVPIGFDRASAAELSKTVTGLAVDLASFNNATDEDALAALKSGLLGEAEPMKKFGVILNEAALKAELLNEKIDPKNATEAQKVYARMQIILRSTADAQGDAVRTSESFSNQLKRLSGEAENAGIAIGQAVLPTVTKWVSQASVGAQAAAAWAAENGNLVQSLLGIGVGLVVVGGSLFVLGKIITIATATTAAIAGITTGLNAAAVAASAFIATPLGGTLAILAVLAAGVAYAVYEMERATNNFARSKEFVKAGEEQRQSHQQSMQTLKQLSAQEKLSDDQKKQSQTIADRLNGAYRGLNLEIDSMTGKLKDAAGAQANLNAEQAKAAKNILKGQLKSIDNDLQNIGANETGALSGLKKVTGLSYFDEKMRDELLRERARVQQQMRDIDRGASPNGAAAPNITAPVGGPQSGERGREIAGANSDANQSKSTTDINQKYDAQAASILSRGAITADEAAKQQAELEAIELARVNELAAVNKQAINEKLALDLAAIDEKYKAEEDAALRKAEREKAIVKAGEDAAREDKRQTDIQLQNEESARKRAEDAADRQRQKDSQLRSAEADALDAEASMADRNQGKGAGDAMREQALAIRQQLERDQKESDWSKAGYSDEQKAKMRDSLDRIQAAQRDAAKPEKAFSSAGTFNAAAIQSLQGGNTQDRIAKATETTAKGVEKVAKGVEDLADNGGLTFD